MYKSERWLWAAVLLCGCQALSAAGRDYWMTIETRGTVFGWSHTVVTEISDGNLRYDTAYRVRAGTGKVSEIESAGSWVVDSRLRPVSFTSEFREDTRETRSEGRRSGDAMVVSALDHDGRRRRRTIRLRDLYFECVVNDLILRRHAEERFDLRTMDPDTLRVATSRVEIAKSPAGEIEATIWDGKEATVHRIAHDGRVLEILLPAAGIGFYSSTAEEARKPGATLSQAFIGEIRSRNPFPNPFNLISGRVRVHWVRTKPRELVLHDNRQTVVRVGRTSYGYEAVLDLGAPHPLTPLAGPGPKTVLLADERYVQPTHPAIRKKAAEIVGGLKDPAKSVRKLLEWVSGFIEYKLRDAIWTGPQLLEHPAGRCADYAVLFASLARAAGIPTRMVLGVAYHDGLWGGHMWNEVWLGKWVPVDPTAGDLVTGPGYIKFKDDATVEGVMRAGPAIAGMTIDIVGYREEGFNPALKTGVEGSTYVNASYHCRISAPDGSWALEESRRSNGAPLLLLKPGQGGEAVTLSLNGVPPRTEATGVLDLLVKQLAAADPKTQVIGRDELKIAGRTALRATVQQPDGVWNHSVLVDRNAAYIFAWRNDQDETVRRILASFELLP